MLTNQNKPIRETAESLAVSTVWNILRKKEHTRELGLRRPWKTAEVDGRVLSLSSQQLARSRTISMEAAGGVSTSTIKRNDKSWGTTEGSPQDASHQWGSKTAVEFAKQHLETPSSFWNNILWTDGMKLYLYQSNGKRRNKASRCRRTMSSIAMPTQMKSFFEAKKWSVIQ